MYILFGASGRIGRICVKTLNDLGKTFATVSRNGDIFYKNKIIGNYLNENLFGWQKSLIIDASIDYSSSSNLSIFEKSKRTFLQRLDAHGSLSGVVGFSSGAVDFLDEEIISDFYLNYKKEKLKLEKLLFELSCPVYCPRIYTLIGPESFKLKTIGWVDVITQAMSQDTVAIGDDLEMRTWVSEDLIQNQLKDFLVNPRGKWLTTPVSGIFNLGQLVEIISKNKHKSIRIIKIECMKWLSVPYVSNQYSSNDLEKILLQIIP